MEIRLEAEQDFREAEEVTREAFWNVHQPGCEEHFVLHRIRSSPEFIPELTFVAVENGKIVGQITYTRSRIQLDQGGEKTVITFGPIGVLPEYKGQGIGSALICHSLKKAQEMGYPAVCIYGDPRYYGRFGFRCGERYEIKAADGAYAIPLLAMELQPGGLSDAAGRFLEDECFEVERDALEAYDKGFPQKEKAETESQKEFELLVTLRYRKSETEPILRK